MKFQVQFCFTFLTCILFPIKVGSFPQLKCKQNAFTGETNKTDYFPAPIHHENETAKSVEDLCPSITTSTTIDNNSTRYDKNNNKCATIDKQEHCSENMIFYSYPDSEVYGQCDCKYTFGFTKPFIYDLERDQCYMLFDQAYCNYGEWIILNEEKGLPECTQNKCLNILVGTVPQNSSEFILYKDECVKLNGPHSDCNKKSEILSFDDNDLVPKCIDPTVAIDRGVGVFQKLKCKPGTYLSVSGRCQKGYNWGRSMSNVRG